MSKVRLKDAIQEIGGTIYEVKLNRAHQADWEPTKHPHQHHASNVEPSEAQKAQRQRFKEAIAYAKAAMADERLHRKYENAAKRQGKQPFGLAVSDYLQGINLLSS